MDAQELQEFRDNDPRRTKWQLHLDQFDDESLRNAIEVVIQNTVVSEIQICGQFLFWSNPFPNDLTALLGLLENREMLKKVEIFEIEATAVVSRILQALQRRVLLETLSIVAEELRVEDFTNVIDRVKNVDLDACHFLPSPGHSTEELSAAFASNTTIQMLELKHLPQDILISILNGLQSNKSVQKLVICHQETTAPIPFRHAMEELFLATQSLQEVAFLWFTVSAESFGEIPWHIANSTSIKRISFTECNFDATSLQVIGTMFGQQSNSDSLVINDYDGPESDTLVAQVLGKQSSLRHFRLSQHRMGNRFTREQFAEMLQVVKNNEKLETFDVGVISDADKALILRASIPHMQHLKHFEFELEDDLISHPFVKAAFLHAFKENWSLLSVKHNDHGGDVPFFGEEEEAELEAHLSFNCFWNHWYANSNSVSLALLPRMAARASKHPLGPTALFQSLKDNDRLFSRFLANDSAALPVIPLRPQFITELHKQNIMHPNQTEQQIPNCLTAQLNQSEKEVARLREQNEALRDQFAQLQYQKEHQANENRRLVEENALKQSKIDSMQKQIADFSQNRNRLLARARGRGRRLFSKAQSSQD